MSYRNLRFLEYVMTSISAGLPVTPKPAGLPVTANPKGVSWRILGRGDHKT